MTLDLEVLTSKGLMLKEQAEEVILPTNSGQIGVLTNHAALLTGLQIGVLKARIQGKWIVIAIFGGFAHIDNNKVWVLASDAENASTIVLAEAEVALTLAQVRLSQATKLREQIEADLVYKRARARLEAAQALQR